MKVLIITLNNSSPKGGSEKLWRELAKGLKNKGHDVAVSVYAHQVAYQRERLGDGIKVHSRVPKRYGNSIIQKVFYYALGGRIEGIQIKKLVRRERPNHIFFSFGGFAELDNPNLLRTFLSLATVFSAVFHSNTEDYGFQRDSIELAQQFCAVASGIYLVSERIGEIFRRQVGMTDFNYRLIINPMHEPEEVSTVVYDVPSDIIQIAFIGTLDIGVKGVALLLQAMASPTLAKSNVVLNLYGEGEDRDVIALLIKSFGLSDRVFLQGWSDDIDAVWNGHHLLVLPSFNEGMPMVIHEAMLRQRVVLATDVGGNGEIIEDGVTGFLAPSASLKHITQTFARCLAQRNQWSAIAKNARTKILDIRHNKLTIEDIIAELSHDQN